MPRQADVLNDLHAVAAIRPLTKRPQEGAVCQRFFFLEIRMFVGPATR